MRGRFVNELWAALRAVLDRRHPGDNQSRSGKIARAQIGDQFSPFLRGDAAERPILHQTAPFHTKRSEAVVLIHHVPESMLRCCA